MMWTTPPINSARVCGGIASYRAWNSARWRRWPWIRGGVLVRRSVVLMAALPGPRGDRGRPSSYSKRRRDVAIDARPNPIGRASLPSWGWSRGNRAAHRQAPGDVHAVPDRGGRGGVALVAVAA